MFYAYHSSVAFEVVANISKEAQFVHSFLKLGDFLENFPAWHGVFAYVLLPQVVVFWRVLSSFVGFPKGQSVIEEKGEGFENGKIQLASLVSFQPQ